MMRIGPNVSIAVSSISQQENPQNRAPQTPNTDSSFIGTSRTSSQTSNRAKNALSIPGTKFQPPDDDVSVTWARELKGETVVYELKDKASGTVMLQVPSDEVLGVSQSIASELSQSEKSTQQTTEVDGAEGGNTNVSKL